MLRCLDLGCGAGGATRGYQLAGFHVTGVDVNPQPHYVGDAFIQADALTFPLEGFDLVHASMPCKAFTRMQAQWGKVWPDLVTPMLARLELSGAHWVMENVPGAPFVPGVVLCGSSFGLGVRRHRWFKCSFKVAQPLCRHRDQGRVVQVNGHPGGSSTRDGARHTTAEWSKAMGIDWMPHRAMSQSIPPVYTEYIGLAFRASQDQAL